MKPLAEQNYYEVLEIQQTAGWRDIQRAYDLAQTTYSGAAMASMPLFTPKERAEIIQKIEEAYRIFQDPDKKRQYDIACGFIADSDTNRFQARGEEAVTILEGEIHGSALRQMREQQGQSLQDMASQTRINVAYLHAIEDEQMAHFPAEAYLRGYLRQYASALRLDIRVVTEGYLQRYHTWQQKTDR